MKLKLKTRPSDILLSVYLFLFIFTMVNREFAPFGIDLRYVVLPLGALLLIVRFLFANKLKIKHEKDSAYKWIIAFYIWVFVSNLAWLFNGLEMNQVKFSNEIILLINVFVSILVIYFYRPRISADFVNKSVVVSCLVLCLSMILVGMGFTAEQIFATSNEAVAYYSTEDVPHRNLYGWEFRPAGYASDPNYATILLLFGVLSVFKLHMKKYLKIILYAIFIALIGISFSKTVVVAAIIALPLTILKNNNDIKKQLKSVVLVFATILISLVVPISPNVIDILPNTLSLRAEMWSSAKTLFEKNPVIGNGITSFRSHFAETRWYVHTHNTYWQVLSETGIIGLILLAGALITILRQRSDDKAVFFITAVFVIFMITYETIALQFIVYFFCLCNLNYERKNK